MLQLKQPLKLSLNNKLFKYIPIYDFNNQNDFYTGINNNLISNFILDNNNEYYTKFTAPLVIGKSHNLLELMSLCAYYKDSKVTSRIASHIDNDVIISRCYVEHPSKVIKIFRPLEDSGVLINISSNTCGIISVLEANYSLHHEQDDLTGIAFYTIRFSLDVNLNMSNSVFKSSIYTKPYVHDARFIHNKQNYLLKCNKKQMKSINQLLNYSKIKGIDLEAYVY